jgi:hypothetical protein
MIGVSSVLVDGMVCIGCMRWIVWITSVSDKITYCKIVSIMLETKAKVEEHIPLAVDALSLVLANDDVTESSAILEDEDSVLLATLDLVVARTATTVVLGGYQLCCLKQVSQI